MHIKIKMTAFAFATMMSVGATADDAPKTPDAGQQAAALGKLPATAAGTELDARQRAEQQRLEMRARIDRNMDKGASALTLGL